MVVHQLDPGFRERIANAPSARLATVRPDGAPHIVPIAFVLAADTITTAVDHKPKATRALQRLRNIRADSRVSVLVDHYDDDWSRLWWARADGTAVIDDHTDHPDAIAGLVGKYRQYRDRPPEASLIVVTVERWTTWLAAER